MSHLESFSSMLLHLYMCPASLLFFKAQQMCRWVQRMTQTNHKVRNIRVFLYTKLFFYLYAYDKHQCNTITHNSPPSSFVFLHYVDIIVVKSSNKTGLSGGLFFVSVTSLLWVSQGLHQLNFLQRKSAAILSWLLKFSPCFWLYRFSRITWPVYFTCYFLLRDFFVVLEHLGLIVWCTSWLVCLHKIIFLFSLSHYLSFRSILKMLLWYFLIL